MFELIFRSYSSFPLQVFSTVSVFIHLLRASFSRFTRMKKLKNSF
ncbi:hypothetical protein HJ01_01397 [Flavobacterium frigoris PS1]|uniref:Uncharacterized protein n=1 Tax=Flavobacterium frigoris (strain PS1) TaxID=1086011 RepID=H7FQD7_FLAFP|nr:hypothetical protein HJ01_01397 [Flavobacterium frigoris PS1]